MASWEISTSIVGSLCDHGSVVLVSWSPYWPRSSLIQEKSQPNSALFEISRSLGLALKSSRSSARGWCMLQISRRPPCAMRMMRYERKSSKGYSATPASASCAKTRPSIKAQLASRPVVGSSAALSAQTSLQQCPPQARVEVEPSCVQHHDGR